MYRIHSHYNKLVSFASFCYLVIFTTQSVWQLATIVYFDFFQWTNFLSLFSLNFAET